MEGSEVSVKHVRYDHRSRQDKWNSNIFSCHCSMILNIKS
jgi:hypothetical protein